MAEPTTPSEVARERHRESPNAHDAQGPLHLSAVTGNWASSSSVHSFKALTKTCKNHRNNETLLDEDIKKSISTLNRLNILKYAFPKKVLTSQSDENIYHTYSRLNWMVRIRLEL